MAGSYVHATDRDVSDLIGKGVAADVAQALVDYVNRGVAPDSFLRAVLANDLSGACAQAPCEIGAWLKHMTQWIYWYVPSEAWRSREKVAAWCEKGGIAGHPPLTPVRSDG